VSGDAVWALWVVLGCVVGALEIAARLGVDGLATIGAVVGRLRARGVGRGALVVFWCWLGWHLFAR
jgi:hypothetical protein